MTNSAVTQAMEYAYRAEGVKNFTVVGCMFTSGVQHSAARTRAIMSRAQRHLDMNKVAVTLQMVRANNGEMMHFITQ
jgi:hypothetical protein